MKATCDIVAGLSALVGMSRSESVTRAVIKPEKVSFGLSLVDLEPSLAPDAEAVLIAATKRQTHHAHSR